MVVFVFNLFLLTIWFIYVHALQNIYGDTVKSKWEELLVRKNINELISV